MIYLTDQLFDPSLPVYTVDFQLAKPCCGELEDCTEYANHLLGLEKSTRKYVGIEAPENNQLVVALIDLRSLTYETYLKKLRSKYKGNVLYNAKKADSQGYTCKPFVRKLFIPDIVEINHSKEVRSCGAMPPSYLRTVDEMGGAPEEYVEWKPPACPTHYAMLFGIFMPVPGYKQGNVVTNEKLLAYIRLRRIGNFSTYSMIIGHGDYLQYGIMYRLHLAVMKWLCQENKYSQGLELLIYASYYDGNDGLILWKKKTGFEPAYLVTHH